MLLPIRGGAPLVLGKIGMTNDLSLQRSGLRNFSIPRSWEGKNCDPNILGLTLRPAGISPGFFRDSSITTASSHNGTHQVEPNL